MTDEQTGVVESLLHSLRATAWERTVVSFLREPDGQSLIDFLLQQKKAIKRFCPPLNVAFRALVHTQPADVRILLLGGSLNNDPLSENVLSGQPGYLAPVTDMDWEPERPSRLAGHVQAGFGDISDSPLPYLIDAHDWGAQGVLSLGNSFTVPLEASYTELDALAHAEHWQPLIERITDKLMCRPIPPTVVLISEPAMITRLQSEGYLVARDPRRTLRQRLRAWPDAHVLLEAGLKQAARDGLPPVDWTRSARTLKML